MSGAADRRGRPARVPDMLRAHADHHVHHPSLGDRPGPRAPSRTIAHHRARTTREPPAGPRNPPSARDPREPARVTRPTPARRRPDRPLEPDPTPLHHAGKFGVRSRLPAASPRPPPAQAHPPGPQAERTAMHTGALAIAPTPAHRCARGQGPRVILCAPRVNLLFRISTTAHEMTPSVSPGVGAALVANFIGAPVTGSRAHNHPTLSRARS